MLVYSASWLCFQPSHVFQQSFNNVFSSHIFSTVTSAVFTSKADHVVSGSDDRTVKVDLSQLFILFHSKMLDRAVVTVSQFVQRIVPSIFW